MKKRLILPIGLMTFVFCIPISFAAEMTEARIQYRKSTLNSLIIESQKEKEWPRRAPNQYSRKHSDHFSLGSGSPFELEPVGPSAGDVVGA